MHARKRPVRQLRARDREAVMSHRAYAVAAYTAGACAAAFAIITAEVALWWPTALLVVSATAFYGLGDYQRDAHQAARDREEAARPQGPNPPTIKPCCAFWQASGTIHGNLCPTTFDPTGGRTFIEGANALIAALDEPKEPTT